MFNGKRIKELEDRVDELVAQLSDLRYEMQANTVIHVGKFSNNTYWCGADTRPKITAVQAVKQITDHLGVDFEAFKSIPADVLLVKKNGAAS